MHLPDLSQLPFAKDAVQFAIKQGWQLYQARRRNAEIDERIDKRIDETLRAFIESVRGQQSAVCANLDVQRCEPGLSAFVADALESSVNSSCEAKRLLLGDIIARRFTTEGESADGVALSLARTIVAEATEVQLLLLGNAWIKDFDKQVNGATGAAIEKSLSGSYRNTITSELSSQYTYRDLDHLEALGAARQGSRSSSAALGGPESYAATWLKRRGLATVDDRPLFDSEMYPVLSTWSRRNQYPTKEEFDAGAPPSIEDVYLTPAGVEIGRIIVERLH